MLKKNLVYLVTVGFLLTSLGTAALGQGTSVDMRGTVYDQSQAVLPGVTVTATDPQTGLVRTVVTDDEGRYTIAQLRPARYQVAAELPGFQRATQQATLTLQGSAVIDFTLSVGAADTEIVVTSEAPLVDTASSSVVGLVDDQQIRSLPLNGRSFTDLATLQPGVFVRYDASNNQVGNEGIKLSINGTRTTQQSFLLDGTDIRNQMQTTPGSLAGVLLGVDTVQEFSVISGLANAEYGAFTGGVISAVTRSGTNSFHGSIFEFHRNSALDARNFFSRDPSNPLERSDPDAFIRNQYGFTAGGPIVKDKLFFFGSFEGLNDRLTTTEIQQVPSLDARNGIFSDGTTVTPAANTSSVVNFYPLPNAGAPRGDIADYLFSNPRNVDEYYYLIKIDWQVSDKDSIAGRYILDDATKVQFLGRPFFGFDQAQDDLVSRTQFSMIEWKRIVSPTIVNEARISYNRSHNADDPVFVEQFPDSMFYNDKLFNFAGDPWPGAVETFAETSRLGFMFVLGKSNTLNRFQYIDNLSITSGAHSIKTGFNIHRLQFNYDAPIFAPGIVRWRTVKDMVSGASPFLFLGTITGRSPRGMRQWLYGFYVQDNWKIRPNLTLNLGLRYEPYSTVTEVNNIISGVRHPSDQFLTNGNPLFIKNPSNTNFAPRVGVAWDPFGDGKTSIRAGYGLFYELIQPVHYFSNINVNPPSAIRVLRVKFAPFVPDIPFPDPAQGLSESDCTTTNNETRCSFPVSPWSLSEEIEQGGLHQFQFSIQRELARNFMLSVGYKGSKGYNLGHIVDVNTAIPQTDANGIFPYWPVGSAKRNPAFGQQRDMAWDMNSWYNSLEISAKKRFSQGYSLQLAYTYGKSIDEGSSTTVFDDGGTRNGAVFFPDDPSFDKGLSAFDVRNRMVINGSVDLPFGQGRAFGSNWSGALQHILGGWSANGILTASDGAHMNLFLSFNQSNNQQTNDVADRPNLIPGGNNNLILNDGRDPNLYYDPFQFEVLQGQTCIDDPRAGCPGYLSNLGRNTIEMPGVLTADFSLLKDIHFTEDYSLQFRAEFFNIFNRANFGRPAAEQAGQPFVTATVRNPNAGRINDTITSARQIQFALKLVF